jgi:hypothetical protein
MRIILTILAILLFVVALLALSQGDKWVSLGCVVAGIACFMPMWKFMKQRDADNRALQQSQLKAAFESAEKEAAQYRNASALTEVPDLVQGSSDIILGNEERCVALSRDARRIVSRKRTKIVGQTAGVSYKVTKNTRVRFGGFQGEPQTTTYEDESDVGTVYVTNQRFIFGGAKQVVTVSVAKVAKVAIGGNNDILQILSENQEIPLTVRITEPFRAPVIAAATQCMVKHALNVEEPARDVRRR